MRLGVLSSVSMTPAEQLDALKPSIDFLARRLVGPAFPYIDRRDLEQDAIVAILERADRFDGSTKVVTFHGQRMAGAMVDGLRKWDNRRKGRPQIVWQSLTPKHAGTIQSKVSAVETDLIEAQGVQQVRNAIKNLPRSEAYVIWRLFVEDASAREVAKEIGRVPSRVFQIRRAGLNRLRHTLREVA